LEPQARNQLLSQFSTTLKKLKEGGRIQDSSIEIMSFIIQDLLDYAQIKAGKFRKNIEAFDVEEAVAKVLSI